METLIEFLKNCGLLDLLVIASAVILILSGIIVLIIARARKPVYGFLAAVLLPLILGVLDFDLKNRFLEQGYGFVGRLDAEAIEAGKRDLLVVVGIGIAGTIVSVSIGFFGLALRGARKG